MSKPCAILNLLTINTTMYYKFLPNFCPLFYEIQSSFKVTAGLPLEGCPLLFDLLLEVRLLLNSPRTAFVDTSVACSL